MELFTQFYVSENEMLISFLLSLMLLYIGVSQYEVCKKRKRIRENFQIPLYSMRIAFTSILIVWLYAFVY